MRTWCIGLRALYGVERGDRVHARLESITGHRCPCTYGQPCGALPKPGPVEDAAHWDNSVAAMDSVTPQAVALRILR